MDLLIWRLYFGELAEGDAFTPMIHAAAKHSREEGVIVRQMNKRDLENEVRRFMDVYNEAWGKNWGFVPITEAEVKFQAKNLKPVLDEHWAMIAELDGKVVGAALTLPDVNQALKKMNGKLFPVGWWHFLRRKKYIDRLRVFALGVKSDYQHLGVAAALYERHLEMAQDPGPGRWPHGLDPRDQQADEPRARGNGRDRRQDATGSTRRRSRPPSGRCLGCRLTRV